MALWHRKDKAERKERKRKNTAADSGDKGVTAVILAGGSSTRMGGLDKLSAVVMGRTVLAWSLRAFQACDIIREIILVTSEAGEKNAFLSCDGCDKVARVVRGGSTRTASAYQGVMAADPKAKIILLHDAARPLVTDAVIRAAAEGARLYGAAVPVVPVTDTIKTGSAGFVDSTPDRSTLYAAQTPQAFRSELIKAALTDAVEKNVALTDDCSAVERLGMRVRLVDGDMENRKITTLPDLSMAEAMLRIRLGETAQEADTDADRTRV